MTNTILNIFLVIPWLFIFYCRNVNGETNNKPHIFFIMADDYGWANIGYHKYFSLFSFSSLFLFWFSFSLLFFLSPPLFFFYSFNWGKHWTPSISLSSFLSFSPFFSFCSSFFLSSPLIHLLFFLKWIFFIMEDDYGWANIEYH